MKNTIDKLDERVKALEDKVSLLYTAPPTIAICPAKPEPTVKQTQEKADDDEDVDLFGSDSEASEQ